MTEAEKRLAPIIAKVDRAKKHIVDLVALKESFFKIHSKSTFTEFNLEIRQFVRKIGVVPDTHPNFAVIAGDVLHDLRSALNHLIHQLFVANNPGSLPSRQADFPIYRSASEYKSSRSRKVQGLRKDAIKFIDDAEPYKGGNNALWQLSKLNNIDKHHLLVTTYADFYGMNVPIGNGRKELVTWQTQLRPLQSGQILFFYENPPDPEADKNVEFLFEIMFNEPGICEGYPLIGTLEHLTDTVNSIVRPAITLLY